MERNCPLSLRNKTLNYCRDTATHMQKEVCSIYFRGIFFFLHRQLNYLIKQSEAEWIFVKEKGKRIHLLI